MIYYVYILYSVCYDTYYVGQTNDIVNRLLRYHSGMEKATRPYIPWQMVCDIEKQTRSEAMILEKKLKNVSKERIRQFIEKYSRGNANDDQNIGIENLSSL